MVENTEQFNAWLASKSPKFQEFLDNQNVLKKENEEQKEIIGSLGKQLVVEKLTRAKNEESLRVLGKQLVEIKLSLKGDK